jgi:hypothetical protein
MYFMMMRTTCRFVTLSGSQNVFEARWISAAMTPIVSPSSKPKQNIPANRRFYLQLKVNVSTEARLS